MQWLPPPKFYLHHYSFIFCAKKQNKLKNFNFLPVSLVSFNEVLLFK